MFISELTEEIEFLLSLDQRTARWVNLMKIKAIGGLLLISNKSHPVAIEKSVLIDLEHWLPYKTTLDLRYLYLKCDYPFSHRVETKYTAKEILTSVHKPVLGLDYSIHEIYINEFEAAE